MFPRAVATGERSIASAPDGTHFDDAESGTPAEASRRFREKKAIERSGLRKAKSSRKINRLPADVSIRAKGRKSGKLAVDVPESRTVDLFRDSLPTSTSDLTLAAPSLGTPTLPWTV